LAENNRAGIGGVVAEKGEKNYTEGNLEDWEDPNTREKAGTAAESGHVYVCKTFKM
jgi:hypothetical protein